MAFEQGVRSPAHMDFERGTNGFSVSLSGDNEALLTELFVGWLVNISAWAA